MKAASRFLCALLGTVLGTSGCKTDVTYDDPPYLYNRRGDVVTLALEAGDFERAEAALASGKNAEYLELIRSGRFFPAANGTGVVVLEKQSGVSKVRVRKDGREGFVHDRYVLLK